MTDPGFPPEIIDRMGEPYVTSARGRRMRGQELPGLGLGFFIAKTLLARVGSKNILENKQFPHRGAVVTVRWNRADFERPVVGRHQAACPPTRKQRTTSKPRLLPKAADRICLLRSSLFQGPSIDRRRPKAIMHNESATEVTMTDIIPAIPGDRSLLIVEDDKSFLQRLARAMEGRGFA